MAFSVKIAFLYDCILSYLEVPAGKMDLSIGRIRQLVALLLRPDSVREHQNFHLCRGGGHPDIPINEQCHQPRAW